MRSTHCCGFSGRAAPGCLPDYNRELLEKELRLFPDWYLARQLQRKLDSAQLQTLGSVFGRSSRTTSGRRGCSCTATTIRTSWSASPRLEFSFQDACTGRSPTISSPLLRDAYIAWDEERVIDWAIRYWERARRGAAGRRRLRGFLPDSSGWGAQRQLKVLGIFASLPSARNGYLKDQPLVMSYLRRTCERYRELAALARAASRNSNRRKSALSYTL